MNVHPASHLLEAVNPATSLAPMPTAPAQQPGGAPRGLWYATLRDRLDVLHSSAQERDAKVIDLSSTTRRQQRGRNLQ
jgi:hypothetical protein